MCVCATVHRANGLETDHVILVTLTEEVSDTLLYIGVRRAVTALTVVSPTKVGERLGLVDAAGSFVERATSTDPTVR